MATDDEVRHAIAVASCDLKVVVESGGAVALPAALTGRVALRDQTAVVVLSGGNVDPTHYAEAFAPLR